MRVRAFAQGRQFVAVHGRMGLLIPPVGLSSSALAFRQAVRPLLGLLVVSRVFVREGRACSTSAAQPFHREDVTRQAGRRLSCQTLGIRERLRGTQGGNYD
jgi:hypothetical protein